MTATDIEWSDEVWNPTTGCDRVSPGCDNCYALTLARRLKGMGAEKYQRDGDPRTSGPGFGLTVHEDALRAPLAWRKPRKVFVNSMSDLFHQDVPDEFIAQVFTVMAATPHHTYQVLTKRHGRMRSLLSSDAFRQRVAGWYPSYHTIRSQDPCAWPLPNVWLGVSVEDQRWADIRIPALIDTPAAVRFLSCEPLIGKVDLLSRLVGKVWPDTSRGAGGIGGQMVTVDPSPIDWVIVGGESGAGARPLDLAWVQRIVDDCRVCGVAPFVKQLGSAYGPHKGGDMATWPPELRVREFPAVAS